MLKYSEQMTLFLQFHVMLATHLAIFICGTCLKSIYVKSSSFFFWLEMEAELVDKMILVIDELLSLLVIFLYWGLSTMQ